MKKMTLAAFAALTATSTVFGQTTFQIGSDKKTDLTIYGVADLAVAHYSTSGQSKTTLASGASGSRLGFLAGRNLGEDLRISARLEAGINLDSGRSSSTSGAADRVWGRQAYLELAGKSWGTVRAGRLQGPIYDFFPRFDPMLLPPVDAWGVLTTLGAPAPGGASGTGLPSGFMINPTMRTENSIEYISPRLGGLQAKVAYSLNEASPTAPKLLEASLDYEVGKLVVGLLGARASSTPGGGTVLATKAVTEVGLGASYQFGPVNPYVTVIRRSMTDPTVGVGGQALNANSESVRLIGAWIPVTEKGQVRFTYGRYSSGAANRDATNFGVAYTHNVDPSLMLLVAYSRLTQDSAGQYPMFQSPRPNAGAAVNGIQVGANWRF